MQVSAALDCDEHVIAKPGNDSGGYEALGSFDSNPLRPTSEYSQTPRAHRPITSKCHLDVLFK